MNEKQFKSISNRLDSFVDTYSKVFDRMERILADKRLTKEIDKNELTGDNDNSYTVEYSRKTPGGTEDSGVLTHVYAKNIDCAKTSAKLQLKSRYYSRVTIGRVIKNKDQ